MHPFCRIHPLKCEQDRVAGVADEFEVIPKDHQHRVPERGARPGTHGTFRNKPPIPKDPVLYTAHSFENLPILHPRS
jgi:hypothetical protein